MYNTFNGWKLRGRVVAVGERGSHRNVYGDMMYSIYQTVPRGSSFCYPIPFRRPLGYFYPSY